MSVSYQCLLNCRLRGLQDMRKGAQSGYDHKKYTLSSTSPWGSDIVNRQLNTYVKVGVPISADNAKNIAFVADYTLTDMKLRAGASKYLATQNSGFFNVLFQDEINDSHKFTLALGGTADWFSEDFMRKVAAQKLDPGKTSKAFYNAGVSGEYTFHAGEKFSSILGFRGDWFVFIRHPEMRGLGKTYMRSAFASMLALGKTLPEAAEGAKRFINEAIIAGAEYSIGHGFGPVHHLYKFWK